MTDVEATFQRYYGDRPVMQRIDDALRAAGVDPERPSHRDLWPYDQLHSRGIVATREHAERAHIQTGCTCLLADKIRCHPCLRWLFCARCGAPSMFQLGRQPNIERGAQAIWARAEAKRRGART